MLYSFDWIWSRVTFQGVHYRSYCMHGCAGAGVSNFAWQFIHSGIDCPGTPSPLLLSVAAGNIESSHGRPDPRRQFLGLATDPTQQDSIPLVVAGSWCCPCQCSAAGGARTDSIQQRPLLNRRPFVFGFIQDRMFRFTCKMECTQYHSERFTATSWFLAPACPLTKGRNRMAL